jgi:hypothetical protein
MRYIITTGADAGYFPLIAELVASIRAAIPDRDVAIGVLDAGLLPDQVLWLEQRGILVVRPPVPPGGAAAVRKRPALAVNLGKLWLDVCFPGFDTIVWLDADTWVQDGAAIGELLGASANGALAIVPGSGRCWPRTQDMRWWIGGLGENRSFNYKSARHARLPLSVSRDIGTRALLNAGVYALRTGAPHWKAMRHWQEFILRRGKPFTSDQLAMAVAIYADGHPVELLNDWCNYIHPLKVDPDRAELVEFYYPYRRIGIVHMAAQKTIRVDTNATMPIPGTDGRTYRLNPRFGIFQAAMKRAKDARQPDAAP